MIKICPRCGKEFVVSEENRMPIYEVIMRKSKNGKDNVLKFRDGDLAKDCYEIFENQGYALLVLHKITFTDKGDQIEVLKSNADIIEAVIHDDEAPVDSEVCPRCEVDEELVDAWVEILKKYAWKGKRR